MPQKQPPASTAVSLAGADALGASTVATGIALSMASALAPSYRATPASAVTSAKTVKLRTVRFISLSVLSHSIIREEGQSRYNVAARQIYQRSKERPNNAPTTPTAAMPSVYQITTNGAALSLQ